MYGFVQKLLTNEYNMKDTVLIESPFKERTRQWRYRGTVILAITSHNLVIASGKMRKKENTEKGVPDIRVIELESLCPLDTIDFTVFKRTHKQSIKIAFNNNTARYFELGKMDKRKVFWKLWCLHVEEIRKGPKLWPYSNITECCCCERCQCSNEDRRLKWTDKYLYFGSQRHAEDQIRPTPIPGLGPPEQIKLLYLKPQYFGCWDQAEHWVQCDEEPSTEPRHNFDVFTYTEAPPPATY